jgi:hypothetical protein
MTLPTQLADGVLTQPNGCGFIGQPQSWDFGSAAISISVFACW